MKDERNLITEEDLQEIFSKVALEFHQRAKPVPTGEGKTTNKITKEELLEIFKKVSAEVK